jgi:peptide deformylase
MAETEELDELGASAQDAVSGAVSVASVRDAEQSPELQEPIEDGSDRETTPLAELDPETRARRDAALSHVRKLGDPVLRASALPVDRFDERLRSEIERMGELMGDALGIGLAANQIGVLHRVLVYRADPEDPLTVLVNPVLEWSSEETEIASEGCLSIPFVHVDVERPAEVRVRARDGYGDPLEVRGNGLTARVIQHEMDHLDGILTIDRISRAQRKEAMRAMREALEAAAAGDGADAGDEPAAEARADGEAVPRQDPA